MNKEWAKSKKPQYDVLLDFKELGFILDNHQYRDIISMVDVYHVYVRRLQVDLYITISLLLSLMPRIEVSKIPPR